MIMKCSWYSLPKVPANAPDLFEKLFPIFPCGLSHHRSQVVYDEDGELKVLLAWSANTVLVCFRGSTTAANWVADAMVRSTFR